MNRTQLLGAASAVALACVATASFAKVVVPQGTIYGGGSTLAQFDYIDEFASYAALATAKDATFSTYWEAGSGTGQKAFLNDDLSCDINHVTGGNSGNCTGAAGVTGNTVQYGASDATLNSTQIATWATSSFGQSYAGNLIQLPSMGVGISFPIVDTGVTSNGQVVLTDSDLCGVFSGLITNFSQITDTSTTPAAGVFKLAYRSDGSGTSFLLTNHLNAVCNTSNTKAGVSFTATTTFASLFTSLGGISAVIPNAVGESGSSAVANYISGYSSGAVPQAIAYLSPDFTTIDPLSDATLTNTQGQQVKSTLVVASVKNGKVNYLPTTANVTLALAHATTGSSLTPPSTASQAANPNNWVPLIQVVSTGYPVVGYTTFDFAQCYSDVTVKTGLLLFLKGHYNSATPYGTIQSNNGFVRVANSGASKFLTAINKGIIANSESPAWNTNIGNTTVCPTVTGR
jgi:hypothetical protein